ncbi:hypothetical protein K474DRAFT_890767 [Panus rudis PR-1116 ss-1]|nr:hypothetical protein K474DRAFT_890767 [Panus rudis PR-1116 ss-1]
MGYSRSDRIYRIKTTYHTGRPLNLRSFTGRMGSPTYLANFVAICVTACASMPAVLNYALWSVERM